MKISIKFLFFLMTFVVSLDFVQAVGASFVKYEKVYEDLFLGVNKFSEQELLHIFEMLWEYPDLITKPIEEGDYAGEYVAVNAARFDQNIVLEMLLHLGADVNLRDSVEDFSLLMFAVLHKNVPMVELLLKHKNIDFMFANKYGLSAYDLAKSNKNKKILTLLDKKRLSPSRLLRKMTSYYPL